MLNVKQVNIYYGRRKAVKDVSFGIQAGEIVGLVGPNGAGKTTIMKTLLGLTKFDGEINFDGQKITANHHDVLTKVGALIEQPAIYPFLSGYENLQLYSTDDQDIDELVTRLGMKSYIQRKAKDYSVGMKQKLGIALALLNHPQFVILDEPMNGLDVEATILIRKIIRDYASHGTAFLISSHVLSELQKIMTSVLIINNGQIIMDSPMVRFAEANRKLLMLKTTDMPQTGTIIHNLLVNAPKAPGYLVIKRQDALKIEQQLAKQGIWVLELKPFTFNFEQTIVDILRQKRGEQS